MISGRTKAMVVKERREGGWVRVENWKQEEGELDSLFEKVPQLARGREGKEKSAFCFEMMHDRRENEDRARGPRKLRSQTQGGSKQDGKK